MSAKLSEKFERSKFTLVEEGDGQSEKLINEFDDSFSEVGQPTGGLK
jgi:hypothetical protein